MKYIIMEDTMAMLAEVMETGVIEAELEAARRENPQPHLTVVKKTQPNTSLHGGVFKALALIYAALLAVFWLTFQGDGEALFMVAISSVYLSAYIGTPFVLSRVGGRVDPVQGKPLAAFLREPFETPGRASCQGARRRFRSCWCPWRC